MYFVLHSFLAEKFYHFIGVLLETFERKVFGNDFLHPLLDALHIVQTNASVELQLAVVTFRNGMFQDDVSIRIEVFYGFVQDKKQGTYIGSHSRGATKIQEFYILVVVHPEGKAFHLIVDLSTDRSVWHIQAKTRINIQKCNSDGETF